MPKAIELTIELTVERISCPGVWLCQDGGVSLILFVLGSTYATCVQPPVFPIIYNDVFYFRKRFNNTMCDIRDLSCLLKDETIYCELVQWCDDSKTDCTILAQYLGELSEVLFPPESYRADGVDLLMRRSRDYPGILSPKIEISTKLRLDEFTTDDIGHGPPCRPCKAVKPCRCSHSSRERDKTRQKQVCHTPVYHRACCYNQNRGRSPSRSPSRSRSRAASLRLPCEDAWSVCSLHDPQAKPSGCCSPPKSAPSSVAPPPLCARVFQVYHVTQSPADWTAACTQADDYDDRKFAEDLTAHHRSAEDEEEKEKQKEMKAVERLILDSQYIEQECDSYKRRKKKDISLHKSFGPCSCDICVRYHQLFLTKSNVDQNTVPYNRV